MFCIENILILYLSLYFSNLVSLQYCQFFLSGVAFIVIKSVAFVVIERALSSFFASVNYGCPI